MTVATNASTTVTLVDEDVYYVPEGVLISSVSGQAIQTDGSAPDVFLAIDGAVIAAGSSGNGVRLSSDESREAEVLGASGRQAKSRRRGSLIARFAYRSGGDSGSSLTGSGRQASLERRRRPPVNPDALRTPSLAEYAQFTSKVRGLLVPFPLMFLERQDLKPPLWSKEFLAPAETFQ